MTSNVPTLTSNIPGTAPGEYKGRAEQQEQGQAEQAKLPKSNQEVAGGTLDPAPPYNKMTGRAGGTVTNTGEMFHQKFPSLALK